VPRTSAGTSSRSVPTTSGSDATFSRWSPDAIFDDLLAGLRASEEWTYVEREVEIRLTRR
jgi:hypothetical protein